MSITWCNMLQLSGVIISLLVFGHGMSEDSGKGACFGLRYDLEFLKKITEIEHDHEVMKYLLSRYQQLEDTNLETAKILESQETLIQSLQAEIQETSKASSDGIISIQEELQNQGNEIDELMTTNSRNITLMQEELNRQENAIEALSTSSSRDITSIKQELENHGKNIDDLKIKYENLTADTTIKYRDCEDIHTTDKFARSGVYTIYPTLKFEESGLSVYCDMTTRGGDWIVFQRRLDGSEDFYRDWEDYQKGFGKLNSEFWLGLDNIHALVSNGKWELLINMRDDGKGDKYAMYKTFFVGPASRSYVLTVGDYTGDAGDSLKQHNGYKFSTKDKDNDIWGSNCAVSYTGAWWYQNCHSSNLNGVYGSTGNKGPRWSLFSGSYPIEFVEMKIKRIV